MIEEITDIHKSSIYNKNREEDIYKLTEHEITPAAFINKWYDSFDMLGQSRLLILKSKNMVIEFVSHLQDKKSSSIKNIKTKKIFKHDEVVDRLYTPRNKSSISDIDNKYAHFIHSLRC